MNNNFLLCARPELIVLTAAIQNFLGTKIQELGTDLTAVFVLYQDNAQTVFQYYQHCCLCSA